MLLPLSGGLRLGPMRLSAYGASDAVGVSAAMALSRRAARLVGFDPEVAWDAGLFAVVSCFAASRLLLILRDPVAFVRFPLLILGLPSLTFGGLFFAAVVVWLYLRWKRVPLLPLLDVFAAPGAVLATFLELGHLLDGSEPGMMVGFATTAGAAGGEGRLYPVALYGVVLAALLGLGLWLTLRRRWCTGHVAALGLMVGGSAAFGLSLLSLPAELFGAWPLEPGEVVALGAMLGGSGLWTFAPRTGPKRVPSNERAGTERTTGER